MWTVNLHVILLDEHLAQAFVLIVLPPAYFVSGAGWFFVERPFVGIAIFFFHAAAALVTVGYGVLLVFGAGDFAGPGPDAPVREFFLALSISLLITAVSTVWLAAAEIKCDRAPRNAPPIPPAPNVE